MKLNKSITGLVILTIFILFSCSQARYGSRMVRVKSDHVAQNNNQADRVKKDAIILEGQKDTEIKEVENANLEQVLAYQGETTPPCILPVDKEETTGMAVEYKSPRVASLANKGIAARLANKVLSNKIVERKVEKVTKKRQPTDNSNDLLRTILIILLLLLLAGIVIALLPSPLNWILSLVVTVVIIIYLLKLLM